VALGQRNELAPSGLIQKAYFCHAKCRVIPPRTGSRVGQSRQIHASALCVGVVGGPVRDKCHERGLVRLRADTRVMGIGS
jgi:hypothetical protein